jgi:hypothetical protein
MKNLFLSVFVFMTIALIVPSFVDAQVYNDNMITITKTNPLSFNTVEGVLDQILGTLRGIIVILSLVFIVLGAIFYITSGGDEGRVKFAKGAITASVIGLALGIAAPSFLKQIGDIIGWGSTNSSAVAGALTISQIVTNALNFLLSIFGIIAVIMLVVGGMMYLSSAGDEDRIDTAKKTIKWAIIGIVVAFSAVVIVDQIASLLLGA